MIRRRTTSAYTEEKHSQRVLTAWIIQNLEEGWSLEQVKAFLDAYGMELEEIGTTFVGGKFEVRWKIVTKEQEAGFKLDSFFTNPSQRVSLERSPFPRRSPVHAGSLLISGIAIKLLPSSLLQKLATIKARSQWVGNEFHLPEP